MAAVMSNLGGAKVTMSSASSRARVFSIQRLTSRGGKTLGLTDPWHSVSAGEITACGFGVSL